MRDAKGGADISGPHVNSGIRSDDKRPSTKAFGDKSNSRYDAGEYRGSQRTLHAQMHAMLPADPRLGSSISSTTKHNGKMASIKRKMSDYTQRCSLDINLREENPPVSFDLRVRQTCMQSTDFPSQLTEQPHGELMPSTKRPANLPCQ